MSSSGKGDKAIEVAIGDAKNITGAGEARNRRPRAVERTVPFALFTQSIVIIWYTWPGTARPSPVPAVTGRPGMPPKPAPQAGPGVINHRRRTLPPGPIQARAAPAAVQDRTEPRALPARQEVHLHFDGVTADDVAAILARVNHDDPECAGPREGVW